ncbi:MAG: class I SAM-dependent methyltransferase [Micavibrio aeruginosavorus]|uniref:Class I SAM-dependent methyltransferase n=1 Tax=Micavibrio aeruginosavorus TaxID=349221 RepID=A0A7T5R2D2_9BACT|nr:MAG: class I SAM-dependent methyltransferase [Micavibrio aeruginosavorus]
MSDADPLSALLHALSSCPAVDGDVLFINGIYGPGVDVQSTSWHVLQYFKTEAIRWPDRAILLQDDGLGAGRYDRVLVLISKQHDASRRDLAVAARCLRSGGVLLAAGANDAGGRRIEDDLRALGFSTVSDSRYKSRVVEVRCEGGLHEDVLQNWISSGGWQPVLQEQFVSRPGLFSWDRIDVGSALLAAHITADLGGCGADFGCGYGFLSAHILNHCPGVSFLYALDVDARAVEACRRNTAFAGDRINCFWHDLTTMPPALPMLDFIVMNPPFHEGSLTHKELGRAFIRTASSCLRREGRLLMVANNHLPYEDVLGESFSTVAVTTVAQGYKVIEAIR